MQIMCNVIWHVIRLLFSRGSLSWSVLVLSKEIIRSSDELSLLTRVEDRNTADMAAQFTQIATTNQWIPNKFC